jgi:hypothetical protein
MRSSEVTHGIAYCGLSCTICSHTAEGCIGCRAGGGPEVCGKRQCCEERRFDGCWQCGSFPCAGYFADEAWTGLTIGCVNMIRAMGPEAFESLARSRLGDSFDYGYLRYRAPQEIETILRGQQNVPQDDPDVR